MNATSESREAQPEPGSGARCRSVSGEARGAMVAVIVALVGGFFAPGVNRCANEFWDSRWPRRPQMEVSVVLQEPENDSLVLEVRNHGETFGTIHSVVMCPMGQATLFRRSTGAIPPNWEALLFALARGIEPLEGDFEIRCERDGVAVETTRLPFRSYPGKVGADDAVRVVVDAPPDAFFLTDAMAVRRYKFRGLCTLEVKTSAGWIYTAETCTSRKKGAAGL